LIREHDLAKEGPGTPVQDRSAPGARFERTRTSWACPELGYPAPPHDLAPFSRI